MLILSENEQKLYQHPLYKDYACTLDGRVFSKRINQGGNKTGEFKEIKTRVMKSRGYLNFVICYNNKRKNKLVHHFVYECVTGKQYNYSIKSSDGLTINHNDRDKLNNHFANLSELPNRDNIRDKVIIRKYDLPRYVYFNKRPRSKPYFVAILFNKKIFRYGYFKTVHEAEIVARQKFKELFPNDSYDQ